MATDRIYVYENKEVATKVAQTIVRHLGFDCILVGSAIVAAPEVFDTLMSTTEVPEPIVEGVTA